MKKNRSTVQTSIADHYFSVYPIDMLFQKDYNSKFCVYFEKNLQIISRFDTPAPNIIKDSPLLFQAPQSIQHFRIQSQRSLDYQWSLYKYQNDDDQSEQFIQGRKINLKEYWSNFFAKKQNCQEIELNFEVVKCKLKFLIVIGSSNRELLELAQRYFSQKCKSSAITDKAANELKQKDAVKETLLKKQQNRLEVDVVSQGQVSSMKLETVKGTEIAQQLQEKENIKRIMSQQQQRIVFHPPELQSLVKQPQLMTKLQEPENNKDHLNIIDEDAIAVSPTKRVKVNPYDPNLSPQQNLRLTKSQLDLGNEIEKQIIQSEGADKSSKMMFLQEIHQEILVDQNEPFIALSPMQKKDSQQSIKMTTSQLMNEKGQIIVPFYKDKKIMAVIIVILFIIFGGLAWLNNKNNYPADQKGKMSKKNKNKQKIMEEKNVPQKLKDKVKKQKDMKPKQSKKSK